MYSEFSEVFEVSFLCVVIKYITEHIYDSAFRIQPLLLFQSTLSNPAYPPLRSKWLLKGCRYWLFSFSKTFYKVISNICIFYNNYKNTLLILLLDEQKTLITVCLFLSWALHLNSDNTQCGNPGGGGEQKQCILNLGSA